MRDNELVRERERESQRREYECQIHTAIPALTRTLGRNVRGKWGRKGYRVKNVGEC